MSSYSINSMCISHKDSACIDRIAAAYNKGQLFSDYLPMPEEILRKKRRTDSYSSNSSGIRVVQPL